MNIDSQRVARLANSAAGQSLGGIRRGIEKESLRADASGRLSLLPHPEQLGSALCNSWLTTDFSESLLEFVTPAFDSADTTLNYLEQVHRYASSRLHDGELLWPSSMPCVLPEDERIPLAQYGSSNSATMKTAYRRGLGHRYGRAMQTVAGIHYNFSLPQAFWEAAHAAADDQWQQRPLREYIDYRYLGLIRNFRRYYWLLVYLFGASPVIDPSFVQGREHSLDTLASGDLYSPYATSLRMGDLGYQSKAQRSLFVCYNQLDSYLTTLRTAIRTPYQPYQAFGVEVDGEYQQLSDAILQIENEFYSPIRPKRVTRSGQTPANALSEGGIEYIEIRCLDLDPFAPSGIDRERVALLDTFLLSCLIDDSPLCDEIEFATIGRNQTRVVETGRKPGLELERRDYGRTVSIALEDWGDELLEGMRPVAELLDQLNANAMHTTAIDKAGAMLADPAKTPSARLLAALQAEACSHTEFMQKMAANYAQQFAEQGLSAELEQQLSREAEQSHQQQREIEASDSISFAEFLENYYSM